ncbi:hypothetical protein FIC87_12580 [Eggerthella lenta]|uniref:Uncharacterized protein n=1 Tax=Eggerthella lenta TaxID=84112 RepID=A0A5C5BQP2_EGGLN|nr:hypothetical protein [Eggerthella lenta]TNU89029.1 hypothetical protein FIC87_12580 [Eggerthella lenta]
MTNCFERELAALDEMRRKAAERVEADAMLGFRASTAGLIGCLDRVKRAYVRLVGSAEPSMRRVIEEVDGA